MIDQNHPVRVVNQVIDSIDLDVILKKHTGGGCSSYHPSLPVLTLHCLWYEKQCEHRFEQMILTYLFHLAEFTKSCKSIEYY
jgi:hypothetical protein